MEKIVLVGAGGHCKVIIDIIKSKNEFEIVGVTDFTEGSVLDVPIIGNDNILPKLYEDGVKNAFLCIGGLGNMRKRDSIYNNLKNIGFNMPVLTHSKSIVSPYSNIKDGTCVMAGAIINADANIGENCIINSGSIVEHDCNIGNNTHISPNAVLGGNVNIGKHSHIGIGSSVIQGISIGSDCVVGAGSVVIRNVEDNTKVVGVPSRTINK